MAELKQLKIKRGNIKRAVTLFETYINSLQGDDTDIFELQDRRSHFKQLLSQYNDVQDQIEALQEDNDFNAINIEREIFEKQYYETNGKAEKITQNKQGSAPAATSTNSLRLPEINLPKFSGNYVEWYGFYNSFESLINSNKTLCKIQKLQYLKSVLSGEASKILSSLEITENNYDCAWEMLKQRYDNKRLIINKHIRAIFDLPVLFKENYAILRQIVDGVTKHIRILKSLERPTDNWDDLIVYIISNKLDSSTITEWESSLSKNKSPTLIELTTFLTKKCEILEAVFRKNQPPIATNKTINSSNPKRQPSSLNALVTTNNISCSFCNKDHTIYNCMKFKSLTIKERIKEVQSRNLCMNCLKKGHQSKTCISGSCRKCHKKHNTMIHLDNAPEVTPPSITNHAYHSSVKTTQILLLTAIVNIPDAAGNIHQCRALLDSGSQSCFITRSFAKRLNLPSTSVNIPVLGINQIQSDVSSKIPVAIKSCYNSYQRRVDCLILDRITEQLPLKSIEASQLKIPKNIQLSDPNFYSSSPIDLLIGAELFWDLLCVGQIRQGKHQLLFQKTQLGWIVSGQITSTKSSLNMTSCNLSIDAVLNEKLTQFWNLEECSVNRYLSSEDNSCEEHFLSTYYRNEDGRFIVKIPFKECGVSSLGESRTQAEKRLFAFERKFRKKSIFKGFL